MCGRASITLVEKELEKAFNATFYSDDLERYTGLPNYNVAPTHILPVIRNDDPDHFNLLRWGLIPHWSKDEKIGYKMINARIETLLSKSSFKNPTQKRRCLIPLDGYYEWMKEGKTKTPFRILPESEEPFLVAGIFETWNKGKEPLTTFSIITKQASEDLEHIHDRMPTILNKEMSEVWLQDDIAIEEILKEIQAPLIPMKYYQVSNSVGNVRNNREELIEPVKDNPQDEQLTLF